MMMKLHARTLLPKIAADGSLRIGYATIEILDDDGNVTGELQGVDDGYEFDFDMDSGQIRVTATFDTAVRDEEDEP